MRCGAGYWGDWRGLGLGFKLHLGGVEVGLGRPEFGGGAAAESCTVQGGDTEVSELNKCKLPS